jgi:amino acid adenylation domain-containing protein
MQQGMLFHTLYSPNSGVYFEQLTCTLRKLATAQAFKQAWQQVTDRHPILRTSFVWEGVKEPVQVVYRQVQLPWEECDWQGLAPAAQQQQLETFLKSDRERGFDMRQPPLMRMTLIKLAKDTYYFIWSHHHLLLDGWSNPAILTEVFDFYQAELNGEQLSLPRPRPYRDYIVWIQQQNLSEAESFWRQRLQGFTAPTPMPIERDFGSAAAEESDREQQILLSVATTAALRSLARQQQLTLNTLVQGAWGLLLSRYSGEEDVIFGTVVSGRPPDLAGVESMVGLFVNTQPARVKIRPKDSLLSWLKQLQDRQIEARQYEYSPLVEVQRWSEVPRGLPLFDTLVVFENYPLESSLQKRVQNLEIESVISFEKTNYALTLTVVPGEELALKISYNSNRFEDAAIPFGIASLHARMLGHLQVLLEGIAANPHQPLKNLPLLTPAEKQQTLVEWNGTKAEYPQDRCIHQLFEQQAERTPDAVAVVFEDQKLTYRELNERANQLAHYLQQLGVKSEVLVGICVERSLLTIVGILGILKAGGAYVPLDPANPIERTAFILQDASVSVLLTQETLLETLPSYSCQVVCLDANCPAIAQNSTDNPNSHATAENLAYVIYTSGSTGQPKGVLVTHANVVRLFAATQSWYNFSEGDVWTLFHSYAFDFSVWELWGALIYGGRLVIVPYFVARSPIAFYELLCRERVTVLNQTPSAFRQLMQAEESVQTGNNLSLRWVIFGGEALELPSLKPWFERHGDKSPQLVNMYGITETTVHVTYRPLSLADLNGQGSVIGCAIPDLQLYILDKNRQLVPVGIPGEMYVGGAGVARGYLNRPDLTAERFISNPFSEKKEARLYKTGDLARYLPNGDIEYLGRIDTQVKVRGFRIELGEIEAQLNRHPAVRESAVLLREDAPGDKRLIAYIVATSETTLTTGELHVFLKEKLPDYMVPAAFVLLEALPLTINGKVDRRSLPEPDTARPDLAFDFVAPRTAEEKALAEIWEKILGVEKVGIRDNFFALGGDSIRSIQVQSLAQKQGLRFSLQQLFQSPTIEAIVRELKATEFKDLQPSKSQAFSLILPADKQQIPDNVEDAYPLTALQMGMIFHSEYSQESAIYHDIFSFHLKAPLEIQVLQAAIEYLVKRHAVLRTSFQLTGFSEPLQLVHQKVKFPCRWKICATSPIPSEKRL